MPQTSTPSLYFISMKQHLHMSVANRGPVTSQPRGPPSLGDNRISFSETILRPASDLTRSPLFFTHQCHGERLVFLTNKYTFLPTTAASDGKASTARRKSAFVRSMVRVVYYTLRRALLASICDMVLAHLARHYRDTVKSHGGAVYNADSM